MYRIIAATILALLMVTPTPQAQPVEQWGVYEIVLNGPADGNPFTDVSLSAEFRQGGTTVTPEGFYDGNGVYKIRFMPDAQGIWTYTTRSNAAALDGKTSSFECTAPSAGNHGPVRVADTFRFAYADGTPHFSVGTTCYAWTHQGDELEKQTLETLAASPFNKLRMCVFPKSYSYNKNEPPTYPFPRSEAGENDLTRFNPENFQHFEKRVKQVQDLGIETDIILFHPYDRWGYENLDRETADRYLHYVVARLAAYRGTWWSMANEYDFMKSYTMEDWDHFFQVVQGADPYNHLRGIHNGGPWYDHSKPWVTHLSIQTSDFARAREFREQFKKPVVYDECKYEGNVRQGWGNISPQRMVHNFWAGAVAGCYVGHGETYQHPEDILWWSKGGVIHGQSPARIAFMKSFITGLPWYDMEPNFDLSPGNPVLAQPGERYLLYFAEPGETALNLPGDRPYKVDGIDTWNMRIEPIGTAMPGGYTIAPPTPYYALYLTPYAPGEPIRPEARATASVTEGTVPFEVTFEGPPAVTCAWDFGDGTIGMGNAPAHTYRKHGQYTVSLIVTDGNRQQARTALEVLALPAAPDNLAEANTWPGLRDGLAFSWRGRTGDKLVGKDDPTFAESDAMQLGTGSFFAPGAGTNIISAVGGNNQFALTALVTPENLEQKGPARIATFSLDHNSRNFTLGQEKDKLVLRLRTTENAGNATDPTVMLCALEAGTPLHVTVSYFPGHLACYVNGRLSKTTKELQGDLTNWDETHQLGFGDEQVGGRAWKGKLDAVAVYGRYIGEEEAAKIYELLP